MQSCSIRPFNVLFKFWDGYMGFCARPEAVIRSQSRFSRLCASGFQYFSILIRSVPGQRDQHLSNCGVCRWSPSGRLFSMDWDVGVFVVQIWTTYCTPILQCRVYVLVYAHGEWARHALVYKSQTHHLHPFTAFTIQHCNWLAVILMLLSMWHWQTVLQNRELPIRFTKVSMIQMCRSQPALICIVMRWL